MIVIIDTDRSIIMVITHDDGGGAGNGERRGRGRVWAVYIVEWLACLSTSIYLRRAGAAAAESKESTSQRRQRGQTVSN